MSTRASSSKIPPKKRGSDKTKDKNSKSPPTKKEKSQSCRDKGQASHDKQENEDGKYQNVYVCKFQTPRGQADYHRSLLVEYRKEENRMGKGLISRGSVYEVFGPTMNEARSGSAYQFQLLKEKAPEHSMEFRGKTKLGRVAAHRTDKIREVCRRVTPPSGPPDYRGPPDCNDWLNNVIYRLHQQGIVEFESDYAVPTGEVSLIKSFPEHRDTTSRSRSLTEMNFCKPIYVALFQNHRNEAN